MTEFPDDEERIYCDCVGTIVRYGWQHARDCLHWSPPRRGPGSHPEHREAAMRHIRAVIAEARRRHQEPQDGPQGAGGHTDTPGPERSSPAAADKVAS